MKKSRKGKEEGRVWSSWVNNLKTKTEGRIEGKKGEKMERSGQKQKQIGKDREMRQNNKIGCFERRQKKSLMQKKKTKKIEKRRKQKKEEEKKRRKKKKDRREKEEEKKRG